MLAAIRGGYGVLMLMFCALPVTAGELFSPRTELLPQGEEMTAELRFSATESGDAYVAAQVGNTLFFLGANGFGFQPEPFLRGTALSGNHSLFGIATENLSPGTYALYHVMTASGADPMDSANWRSGLQSLVFTIEPFSSNQPNVDGGAIAVPDTRSSEYTLLAFNDLGMHCMDRDYSTFSILPPFNTVNAQLLRKDGEPRLMDGSQVELRYSPVTDAQGSRNSGSLGKTDFWQYAQALFGQSLAPGEGLTGLFMPADDPANRGPQPLHYDDMKRWFSAEGIPITPVDDGGQSNPYPLLRISAHDRTSGAVLATTDVVVPVSRETDCQNCHATDQIAANNPTIAWSGVSDTEVQTKQNILRLHDLKHGTRLRESTPVLCASCHYSPPLDLAGTGPLGAQRGASTLSAVMHGYHGTRTHLDGSLVFPADAGVEQTCYQCHPGTRTQCQRGAMRDGGMQCNDCHGDMQAVAGAFPLRDGGSLDGGNDGNARRPWQDLPRCQSCHTGDALDHLTGPDLRAHEDGIRLSQAFATGDPAASPLRASNLRFAENVGKLYRDSKGHGEVACEGCHGSTHAVWPNADAAANDNVAATQIQGHSGPILACEACHASLPLTLDGPHGLHNIADPRWSQEEGHGHFYQRNPDSCRACHGADLLGSPLAKMSQTRVITVERRSVTLNQGEPVRCNHCHGLPGQGSGD